MKTILSMKKIKKPKWKYPLLKRDFYIDTKTNPYRQTETKTHRRHHIRDILRKSIFIVVTTDTKGVSESHLNNHLRHHFKTSSTTTVHPDRNLGLPPSSPESYGQEPGIPLLYETWPQSPRFVRLRTRGTPNEPTVDTVVTRPVRVGVQTSTVHSYPWSTSPSPSDPSR